VAACGCVVGASETLIGACRRMATLMELVLATLELSMSKTLIGVITDSMERSWRPGLHGQNLRVERVGGDWVSTALR
jgi:hypothetical protein